MRCGYQTKTYSVFVTHTNGVRYCKESHDTYRRAMRTAKSVLDCINVKYVTIKLERYKVVKILKGKGVEYK
jgi:hypothetical protein